jgi:Fur family transcriptional regulator, ferric uptake regulator
MTARSPGVVKTVSRRLCLRPGPLTLSGLRPRVFGFMGPRPSQPKVRSRSGVPEDPRTRWRDFVAARRLNSSRTREAIVDVFLGTSAHLDLQSLFEIARRQHAGVSFATVYRTMKLLEEAGIAHARRFGDAKGTVFEVAVGRSHHDHLICERCGRIVEFVNPEVERLQDEIAAAHGFTMNRHRHELYGVCASCRTPSARKS